MIKYVMMIMLVAVGSFASAGECANGSCRVVRSRVVNVTKEVVSLPVTVTRKTVDVTRNIGRKTVSKLRNIVR
jgi:hypothetical protein